MRPALKLTGEAFRRVLEVDVIGTTFVAQAVAPRMVAAQAGGRIVNVTSVHEHVPMYRSLAYTAAKHALAGVTKALALELAVHDIPVNSVAPGEIATRMTDNEGADAHTILLPAIPAGRPGEPAEVAATIVFLASPEASYITGASFVVDGGLLLSAGSAGQTLRPDRVPDTGSLPRRAPRAARRSRRHRGKPR